MHDSKLFKISWILLTIGIAAGLLMCIRNIISPFFMEDIFENYMSQSWGDFLQRRPKQAFLYEHLFRLLNCMGFVCYVYALFIILAAYRKGEKWAWAALLTAAILGWGSMIVFASIFSDFDRIARGGINLCVGLVLLLLPVKVIWGAKAGQTS